MRIIFYGTIVLVFILALLIIGQVIYWSSRIFVTRHTATIIHFATIGILTIILLAASAWGHWVTRFKINVSHTNIYSERIPKSFDGYKILQLSDLHLDCFDSEEGHVFLNKIIDVIEQQLPDIIVFTGDLVTTQSSEAEPFREELKRIAQIPVYSVLGNHDYADYTRMTPQEKAEDLQRLCDLQKEVGWHLLRNQGIIITKQSLPTQGKETFSKEHINILGVENIGEPPFSVYGDLTKTMNSVNNDSAWTILLSHNPTHWRTEVLPMTNIDLMLAGHTHAVQIKIGNWTPSKWKYKEWGGLYEASCCKKENNEVLKQTESNHPQYLYVNTGIGGVGPKVRIGIAPEVSILTLRREEK